MVHLNRGAFVGLALFGLLSGSAAAQSEAPPSNDLDAFMEQVLAQRDVNRATLQQYILDEDERFRLLGPARLPLFQRHREFAWYVRDGLHVRSPVKVDGVSLGDAERDAFEREWMEEERRRLERRARRAEDHGEPAPMPDTPPADNMPIAAPRFVSEAYFLDFKFEPGHYLLAGREEIEGRRVLRIEYYPEQMFRDDPDTGRPERRERPRRDRDRGQEEAIERSLNKTALITLWIAPDARQIVKYTFDNVWMDFLPGAWLARVDEVHASMVMGQPFPDVWLPRGLDVQASFVLATGQLAVEYQRAFANYRLAETRTTIRVPKDMAAGDATVGARGSALRARGSALRARRSGLEDLPAPGDTRRPADTSAETAPGGHGPWAPERGQASQEVVREILVHGNVTVPDDEVVRLSGLAVGTAVGPATIEEAAAQLRASRLFQSVEVRKRYRSLVDDTDVAVVLVVHERSGVSITPSGDVRSPGPASRLVSQLMVLPILDYEDGYGWTYGGRIGTHDLFGGGEQLSVPLSWGGTKQASVQVQRTFASGPLTFVRAVAGIVQRENPHYELDDRRSGVAFRAERQLPAALRAGVGTDWHQVRFGSEDTPLWSVNADLVLDTRGNPTFPRNAVFARAGWEGLHAGGGGGRIDRVTADARAYVGLIGQTVLAARVRYIGASDPLPLYEQVLVGGWASLRGERAGAYAGDKSVVTSAEIRVPLTSVLNGSKLGLLMFADRSTAWAAADRLSDAAWHSGAGAGLFLLTPFFRVTLDVAHGVDSGDTRVHFGTGFSF